MRVTSTVESTAAFQTVYAIPCNLLQKGITGITTLRLGEAHVRFEFIRCQLDLLMEPIEKFGLPVEPLVRRAVSVQFESPFPKVVHVFSDVRTKEKQVLLCLCGKPEKLIGVDSCVAENLPEQLSGVIEYR